jgi:putative flippase GtrA
VSAAVPATADRFGRFVVAGGVVACVNLGSDAVLIAAGLPVQLTVAIAYLLAITTHFTLQRVFVFAGRGAYALTIGGQVRRYIAMAAVQYPVTAALAALFVLVGLSDLLSTMAAAVLMSPVTYVLLRTRMFHLADADARDQPV